MKDLGLLSSQRAALCRDGIVGGLWEGGYTECVVWGFRSLRAAPLGISSQLVEHDIAGEFTGQMHNSVDSPTRLRSVRSGLQREEESAVAFVPLGPSHSVSSCAQWDSYILKVQHAFFCMVWPPVKASYFIWHEGPSAKGIRGHALGGDPGDRVLGGEWSTWDSRG